MEINSNEWSKFLIHHAKTFDIDIDRTHIRLFATHALELLKWARKINITTITDPAEVASKHFLDSMAAVHLTAPGGTLLDIGSGGGFPGIPLKVLLPGLRVTLIDASRKKVHFLKHIIRTLNLGDIEAIHTRAEELAAIPGNAKKFDVITSRALSSLESFIRLALPLLAESGRIIALKGQVDESEMNNLQSNVLDKRAGTDPIDRQLTITLEKYSLPLHHSNRSIITVS